MVIFTFVLVHARPGFCSVSQSPVAMLMAAGANGQPGPTARFHAEEESSLGDASVIIHLPRAVEEAAWESLSSRKIAIYTHVQVALSVRSPIQLRL